MLDAGKGLIHEIRLLAIEIGGDAALYMVALLVSAFIIYLLIRQNSKHHALVIKQSDLHNQYTLDELAKVKAAQRDCEAREERLTRTLAKCERRGEELNQLNKDSQQVIKDSYAAQEATSKMLTNMFSKVMDKIN